MADSIAASSPKRPEVRSRLTPVNPHGETDTTKAAKPGSALQPAHTLLYGEQAYEPGSLCLYAIESMAHEEINERATSRKLRLISIRSTPVRLADPRLRCNPRFLRRAAIEQLRYPSSPQTKKNDRLKMSKHAYILAAIFCILAAASEPAAASGQAIPHYRENQKPLEHWLDVWVAGDIRMQIDVNSIDKSRNPRAFTRRTGSHTTPGFYIIEYSLAYCGAHLIDTLHVTTVRDNKVVSELPVRELPASERTFRIPTNNPRINDMYTYVCS